MKRKLVALVLTLTLNGLAVLAEEPQLASDRPVTLAQAKKDLEEATKE